MGDEKTYVFSNDAGEVVFTCEATTYAGAHKAYFRARRMYPDKTISVKLRDYTYSLERRD